MKKISLPIGLLCLLVLVAGLLRLLDLDAKVLHHDESIHAYYSWLLFKDGTYQYHPLSHGPLLYYLVALADQIFGVSDGAARVWPALAGTALVGLIYQARAYLKTTTSLFLVLLAATSPLLIYVSRFARHDMLSLLCTLIIILATLSYLHRRHIISLYALIIAAAVSYANHELTYLTILVWIVAVAASLPLITDKTELRAHLKRDSWHLLTAALIGLFIIALFYSSFGRFPDGLARALPNPWNKDSALGYWIEQHGVHRGGQPIYYYLLTLPLYEIIPFVLGLIGAAWGVIQRRNLAWRFVSVFALGTLALYSIAGERMPWLSVHPLLPLIVASGFLIDAVWPRLGPKARLAGLALAVVAVAFTTFNAYRLAFRNPSNPQEMAVYVQTQPIVKNLRPTLAAQGASLSLAVGTDLSWPMVWYYRDLPYSLTVVKDQPPTAESALFSLDEAKRSQAEAAYPHSDRQPFRSWWVPKKGFPGLKPLARYYFLREPWSPLGSYDFLYLKK